MKVPEYINRKLSYGRYHRLKADELETEVREWLKKKGIDVDDESKPFHYKFAYWLNSTDNYDYHDLIKLIEEYDGSN